MRVTLKALNPTTDRKAISSRTLDPGGINESLTLEAVPKSTNPTTDQN
jgi:hypothetical protein